MPSAMIVQKQSWRCQWLKTNTILRKITDTTKREHEKYSLNDCHCSEEVCYRKSSRGGGMHPK